VLRGAHAKVTGFIQEATVDSRCQTLIGQSALKKINCCKSRGARAPVPHSWRRQCIRHKIHNFKPTKASYLEKQQVYIRDEFIARNGCFVQVGLL